MVSALTHLQDVQGVSTQLVELPCHDRVSRTHVSHQVRQTRTVIPRARHHNLEHLGDTGSVEYEFCCSSVDATVVTHTYPKLTARSLVVRIAIRLPHNPNQRQIRDKWSETKL